MQICTSLTMLDIKAAVSTMAPAVLKDSRIKVLVLSPRI